MRWHLAALRVICVAVAVAAAVGQISDAGGVGALFDLGVSANSLGVGGARAAFRDDAAATALNPAGLAWVEGVEMGTLYVAQFGGVTYGAVAFSAPWVGLAASFVDSGRISSGGTDLRFGAQGVALAGALPLGPVAVAARWRFLHAGELLSGHGWALDAAALVELGPVRVGAIYDALASGAMTYEGGGRETWDSSLCFGAAVTLVPIDGVGWAFTADLDGLLNGPVHVAGGLEVRFGPATARLGWDGWGPTFGASVRVREIEVDWSCAARFDLGMSHRLSVEVLF